MTSAVPRLITASTTLDFLSDVLLINAGSTSINITVPTITGNGIYFSLIRTDTVSANSVTITSSQLINGNSITYLLPGQEITVVAYGNTWYMCQGSDTILLNKVALINQTSSIPSTILYTSPINATYQINVYACCTKTGLLASLGTSLTWVDEVGTQTLNLPSLSLLGLLNGYSQQTVTLRCRAGQNINYSTSLAGTGGPQYSLYMSVIKIFS